MSEWLLYLRPLFLTILFEEGGALLLGLRGRDLLLVLLVNILTNPVLVYLSLFLMYHVGVAAGQVITYLLLEPLVVYVEYRCYKDRLAASVDPLRLSLVLNIISVTGGVLCQKLSG